jgi:spermidine synthase
MVTPIIIKMAVDKNGTVGRSSGRISAVSTAGSVLGVFLTSFVLIPFMGNSVIIIILAVVLAALALLYRIKFLQIFAAAFSIILIIYPISISKFMPNAVEIDTQYGNYLIIDDGQKVQVITHNGIQSQKNKGSNELLSEYLKYYDLAYHFNPNIENTLCIGGAGYVYPQYFVEKYPTANIDVVEIDRKMEEIAKKYFGLQTSDRLRSVITDGRKFLNTNRKQYDAIYGDAFNSSTPPFELLTKEATEKVFAALTDDGVYIVNIVASETGINSGLLKSYYKTLAAVFPFVYTFRVTGTGTELGNKILVAVKSPPQSLTGQDTYLQSMLSKHFTAENNNYKILTDDCAPVDFYTAFY